jgi:undecaprenyl-diphosphatase
MNTLISLTAQYLFLLVPLGMVIVWWRLPSDERPWFLLQALLTGVFAMLLARVGGHFISSPRPFVSGNFTPMIHSSTDNGFPSDHTLLCATMSMLVFLKNRRFAIALLGVSLLVGIARIAAWVHSPVDVAGAFGIALVATALSHLLFLRGKRELLSKNI